MLVGETICRSESVLPRAIVEASIRSSLDSVNSIGGGNFRKNGDCLTIVGLPRLAKKQKNSPSKPI